MRSESLGTLSQSGGAMESDRQIILTLQKSLEAEKLRNLNLSAELDLQRNMSLGSGVGANLTGKLEDRGFYSSAPGKIPPLPSLSYLKGIISHCLFPSKWSNSSKNAKRSFSFWPSKATHNKKLYV